MRKIPSTIASQHPDNAFAPFWDKNGQPFISVYQEINEAVTCFEDLGVSEYMWDWEGKHADAAVIDRLFTDFYGYFSKQQLGRDKFLTFRIPNIWEEKGYNLLQAMTVILGSEDFARDLKFHGRPLFEVILPMTTRANQLTHMQSLFEKLAKFKSKDFTPSQPPNTDYLEIIPLVESAESQVAVDSLLADYVRLHQRHFGRKPEYIRVFLACSDSSLSSGLLAGLLANKLALTRMYEFSQRSGIVIYPFFGPGSLRFRGGLSPYTIDRFIEEFPGVRTVTVQSAFRYDNPMADVKAAIARLEKELPNTKPRLIPAGRQKRLESIGNKSAKYYQGTINNLAKDMQPIFEAVPKRRDRRQHIGLLAYARSVGGQSLPRAITFTGGFYSIGVPPEFIGLGRTLSDLTAGDLKILRSEYKYLANDIVAAGRFLNRQNLATLAKSNPAWQDVQADIAAAETILGVKFEPVTKGEIEHQKLSSKLLNTTDTAELSKLIAKMGKLRRSIG
jgi:phosphoenolpyruvate carboxylase